MNQKQLYKMDLQKINFWKRLELFMVNVNVCDQMSEEEKEMILNVCRQKQEIYISSKEDAAGQPSFAKMKKAFLAGKSRGWEEHGTTAGLLGFKIEAPDWTEWAKENLH